MHVSPDSSSQPPTFDSNGGQSPNLPDGDKSPNLPSGSNDYKMSINYILNTDSDNLAAWLEDKDRINKRLRDIGLTTNVHQAKENNTVYYSKVFRYLGDHHNISTNTCRKATQDLIDHLKTLKVNIPRTKNLYE